MNDIIKKAEKFAKEQYEKSDACCDSYHNWDHIEQVMDIAMKLARHYLEANQEILKIAVLFHDIDYTNPQIHHQDSAKAAEKFLKENNYPEDKIKWVTQVILDHKGSYRREHGDSQAVEGKILYDADKFRLAASEDAHDKYYPLLYFDETRKLVDIYMKDRQKKDNADELQKKCDEYFNGWQRARADYENLEKESKKKQIECASNVKKDLIASLLPVLNSFNQAFRSVPEDKRDDQWVKGFEFIKKQFDDILKEWGIEPIKTIGEKFDPTLHEATGQEESDEKSGIIIKEVMPGYKLNGETIVFAKVIVSK